MIPVPVVERIRRSAGEAYPEECCGFLLAADRDEHGPGPRRVVDAEAAPNRSLEQRARRFVILPEELRTAEERARSAGQLVVGFYHSHPDHPAFPSQYDQAHAWPWYTYLIVSVSAEPHPTTVGAFELDPTLGEFRPVPWTLESVPAGEDPGRAGS